MSQLQASFQSKYRQGTHCKARLATLIDDSFVVLDSNEIEHNQPRNDDTFKMEIFKIRLKKLVTKHSIMNPNQIVTTSEILYGDDLCAMFQKMTKYVAEVQRELGASKRTKPLNTKGSNPELIRNHPDMSDDVVETVIA